LPFVADGRGGAKVAKSDERAMRVRGRFLNPFFRAFPLIILYIKNNLIFKKNN
jgi:hypothetical protein